MKSCVIWTRVSTKYQEDNGASLSDQKKKCELFAKQNGYILTDMKENCNIFLKKTCLTGAFFAEIYEKR